MRSLQVGITGGIGSGKSLVCDIFKILKIPVYSSDERAKVLMNSDEELKGEIIALFGPDSYCSKGLNRSFIAQKVFKNEDLLNQLNNLVHPAVGNDYKNWVGNQTSKYILKEAAILYESGAYKDCDKVIVVSSPDSLRIQRVMKRDGISHDEVLQRMKNQWTQTKKESMADFVIFNDEQNALIPQVLNIHEKLMAL
jgi:dephospho-CoA kinase